MANKGRAAQLFVLENKSIPGLARTEPASWHWRPALNKICSETKVPSIECNSIPHCRSNRGRLPPLENCTEMPRQERHCRRVSLNQFAHRDHLWGQPRERERRPRGPRPLLHLHAIKRSPRMPATSGFFSRRGFFPFSCCVVLPLGRAAGADRGFRKHPLPKHQLMGKHNEEVGMGFLCLGRHCFSRLRTESRYLHRQHDDIL